VLKKKEDEEKSFERIFFISCFCYFCHTFWDGYCYGIKSIKKIK